MRKEGQLIDTKHVILTSKSPDLPKNIKAGYINCPVRPYIPNPMQCFQCQRFGHSKISCRGKHTCARCAVVGHDSDTCTAASLCINCKGEHPAFSCSCPKWKLEKEIKVNKNISYAEARSLVQSTQIRPNISFANAVKSTRSFATQTSVSTQTYPNKSQDTTSRQKNEKPTHSVKKKEIQVQSKPKHTAQKTYNKKP
ncbi:Nucleic-acid-binding protein from mobile element jockey, partial [Stegodyphus mimosarum]